MRSFVPALALLLSVSACAAPRAMGDEPPDPKLLAALAGRQVAGPPRDCLPLLSARDQTTYRGALTFRDGRTLYRNDMQGCYGLDDNVTIVQNIYGSQICRGDIVRLVDRNASGFIRGSCSYGPFVPYRRIGDR